MKELFEQNKVLFLAVITILIAVFLIKNLDKGKLSLIT